MNRKNITNDKKQFIDSLQKVGIHPSALQLEACDTYVNNLIKWQKKINLVGSSTLQEPYTRHVLDAAQLAHLVPRGTLLDVGSGAGIPGLILSIFADNPITLCERNTKKTSFLNNMIRKLSLENKCNVLTQDASDINQSFDSITGRAVTNISHFLSITHQQRHPDTLYILQKGKGAEEELNAAYEFWHFDCSNHNSVVNPDSKVLLISNVRER